LIKNSLADADVFEGRRRIGEGGEFANVRTGNES
jgi:hypothetical protein